MINDLNLYRLEKVEEKVSELQSMKQDIAVIKTVILKDEQEEVRQENKKARITDNIVKLVIGLGGLAIGYYLKS